MPDDFTPVQMAAAVNQTLVPPGTLTSHMLTWWHSSPAGKLHTVSDCRRLAGRAAANLTSFDATLASIDLGQLCKHCSAKLNPTVRGDIEATLTVVDAHDRLAQLLEGDHSWGHLQEAFALSEQLTAVAAAQAGRAGGGERAAAVADLVKAAARPIASWRALLTAEDISYPLTLAAAGLIDHKAAYAAASAEVGINADSLFSSATGSAQWAHLADRAYLRYLAAIRDGASVCAARAGAETAITAEFDRNPWTFRKGSDPAVLAFSGAQFSSPSEWSDAEHDQARRRVSEATLSNWEAQIRQRVDAGRVGGVAVVEGRPWLGGARNHRDSTDRAILIACFSRARLERDRHLIIAPQVVVDRLARQVSDSFPVTLNKLDVDSVSYDGHLGAAQVDLIVSFVSDGMPAADALSAALALSQTGAA